LDEKNRKKEKKKEEKKSALSHSFVYYLIPLFSLYLYLSSIFLCNPISQAANRQ